MEYTVISGYVNYIATSFDDSMRGYMDKRREECIESFKKQVNVKISDGWEPIGGLSVTPVNKSSDVIFSQAMIKK